MVHKNEMLFFKASYTLCNLKTDKQYNTKQELYSHEFIYVKQALLNKVTNAEILMWAYLTPLLKNLTRKCTLRNPN